MCGVKWSRMLSVAFRAAIMMSKQYKPTLDFLLLIVLFKLEFVHQYIGQIQ